MEEYDQNISVEKFVEEIVEEYYDDNRLDRVMAQIYNYFMYRVVMLILGFVALFIVKIIPFSNEQFLTNLWYILLFMMLFTLLYAGSEIGKKWENLIVIDIEGNEVHGMKRLMSSAFAYYLVVEFVEMLLILNFGLTGIVSYLNIIFAVIVFIGLFTRKEFWRPDTRLVKKAQLEEIQKFKYNKKFTN